MLNRSNLGNANLARCDLTVRFAEGANLRNAALGGVAILPAQLRAGIAGGANLTGPRFIGDLPQTNLENAIIAKMDGAADMPNQSMGVICADVVSVSVRGAELPGAELSRADLRSSDLSGARLADARLREAESSGTDLRDADLTGAHPSGSKFIDTNFTRAKSGGADSTAAAFRKMKGLAGASTPGRARPSSCAPVIRHSEHG